MSDITIIPVVWSALPTTEWRALVTAAFHPDYLGVGEAYVGLETIDDKLAELAETDSWSLCWEARAAGQLVGLLVAEVVDDALLIYDIFVSPNHQRQGIGRGLVTAACEAAQTMPGVRRVGTEVNEANAASLGLMRRLGFETVRTSVWLVRPLDAEDIPPSVP